MAKLVVITKGLTVLPHELGDKWTTIGRAEGNTFLIPDASISARHCETLVQGDDLIVRDLQSTNGTFIDDKKITEGILKPGQKLRLGEVELHFDASAPEPIPGSSFVSRMLLAKSGNNPAKPAPTEVVKPVKPSDSSEEAAKKVHVLFVDDSLAFLETFTELCSLLSNEAWEIHTAPSADRALAILQQSPIDLVVLDIGIPMVDGIQLLGIIGRRYPDLKIAVMTGRADENNRATCLANGAELFIEKPASPEGIKVVFNMLNDLVLWTHREGFTGALRQVHLQEVIQIECVGRHSSILEVRNQQVRGQIYIEAGAIIHATTGILTGEKAFNLLLSLRGGEFKLKQFNAPPQRTLHNGWEYMLMEAARRCDEDTVLIARKPGESEAKLAQTAAPEATPLKTPLAGNFDNLDNDIVVVATYDNDGKWKPMDESKK